MLGKVGDRLREYSLDDRVVTRVAGMWRGDAELLAIDFTGPQESERVLLEHDGTMQCKVAGPPALAQFVAELLPARASICPAAALDSALAFEVPTLGDHGSPFAVGTHAQSLMGVEWSTPRIYQAHAVRTVWAGWSQGLVIARVDELHEGDANGSIAWWPGPGTVVHTTSLMADLDGASEELHPVSKERWTPAKSAEAQSDDALIRALETLDLPSWPEDGWLS